MALFTLFLVLLNRNLVRETKRLREVETEPKLEVYLVPHEQSSNIINMVIRNSGGGPARDIKWEINGDEKDLQEREIKITKMSLFHVLHYFPAKEEMRFFFGESVKLLKEPGMKPIEIRVSYKNNELKKKKPEKFIIDLKPWNGMQQIGSPPLFDIARSLQKIQEEMHQALTGFPFPKVITQSIEMFRKEQEERLEEARGIFEKQKQEKNKEKDA